MKYFITGGCGFIGSYLSRQLADEGNKVVCYDAFNNYIDPLKSNYSNTLAMRLTELKDKAEILRGDVRNKGHLLRAIRKSRPDIVVHLAAVPIATKANEFPEDSQGINLNGTLNVLESMRELGGFERFVYTSSSFVYGDFEYEPADENHPTTPIDVYGGTKLCGEILTKAYGKKFGIDYTIIRPSAVYGAGDSNLRVTQLFVQNALKGKPLTVFDDGAERVDFTYVKDTANGFALASKSKKAVNETFNITNGNARSVLDLANAVKDAVPEAKIESRESDFLRPKRGTLSIEKAKSMFGYEPKTSLEEGIKNYVESIKGNKIIW